MGRGRFEWIAENQVSWQFSSEGFTNDKSPKILYFWKNLDMKTIIVNVTDKDENLFKALLQKMGFKSHVVSEDEKEEAALAKWINEGLKTEEVSEETVYNTLRKHGVKI